MQRLKRKQKSSEESFRTDKGTGADKMPEGFLTVEAAFLMLPILGCLALVMFCAFFLHDRCVLASVAYEAAVWDGEQERLLGEADGNRPDPAEAAELIGGGKYRFYHDTEYEGFEDQKNISISASGSSSQAEAFSSGLLLGQAFGSGQIQMSRRITETETGIRKARWLMRKRKGYTK